MGNRLVEKLAERTPALLDLILEQILRSVRHYAADFGVVLREDLLAVFGKISVVESVPEQVDHGVRPADVRVEEGQEPHEFRDDLRVSGH